VSANVAARAPVRRRSPRGWGIWANSRDLIGLLLAVEAIAVIVSIATAFRLHPSAGDYERLALLVAIGISFEEASRRVADKRLRVSSASENSYFDMTSVWTFASAIALPPALAVTLIVVIRLYIWARYQRRTRSHFYRHFYTAAVIVLACHLAHAVWLLLAPTRELLPDGLAPVIGVALALACYRALNAGLIAAAVYLTIRPERSWQSLFGDSESNALELATLCLGGMTALMVNQQPFLAMLVLIPMGVLQRGAFIKELAIAATTDGKTGLLNTAAWTQLAEKELLRAGRELRSGAVLILDMDHFKDVNDAYGHMVGDLALKAAADALAAELRDYDMVGRFGGEEFVAMLPGVDGTAGVAAANRIRERIAGLLVSTNGEGAVRLSASVGVACYPTHGDELGRLLHAADAALYAAKKAGRNCVHLADGESAATWATSPLPNFERE
jgi:diguanylate cyclase (GGDEF)-like protein